MIQKILLPKLGQTMEGATIAKWHKAEGDAVAKGDVLCEITTDKATLEVESYGAGTLRKINASEGAEVAVNEQIGVLAGADEEVPAEVLAYVPKPPAEEEAPAAKVSKPAARPAATKTSRTAAPAASPAAAGPVLAAAAAPPYEVPVAPMAGERLMVTPRARKVARERNLGWRFLVGSGPNGRIRERDVLAYEAEVKQIATPSAMRLAAEKHVDLRQVPPTGPGGRVSEDDVRRAEPSLIAGGFERHEMSAMRRVIAQRMTWSRQFIPQFSLTVNVDMSAAAAFRQGLKDEGTKVSFNDLLVRAVALALRDFPEVASLYDSGTLIRRGGLHVGIAVALDDGLIVPVVKDADKKTLAELSAAAKDLVTRARSNKLTPDEYTGGVITVSNLGMLGIDEFTAIVNPGESAIVACGTITDTPVVVDGGVLARPMMKVTGSFDHRATDGAVGARFLARIRELLEAPEGLA
jgi:pyruvate dehydrogenase E2 component (dihydrolipoamide acetyltransferase)